MMYDCMSLNIVLHVPQANSADLDVMSPVLACHFGLHCVPKYLFTDIKKEHGLMG